MHYLFIFIAILVLMNSYVAHRITSCFTQIENKYPTIISVVVILTFLQSIALFAKHPMLLLIEHKYNLSTILLFIYRASYLLIGIISCLVFYILLADIAKLILRFVFSSSSLVYLIFARFSPFAAVLITIVTSIFGVVNIIEGPIVKKVEITLKNLPKNFDGFTIAQISDLHIGPTIKFPYVQKVVNITNILQPDLIALTGDFVDGKPNYLRKDVSPLGKLQAKHGVFFISGNHEYYAGAQEWFEELENLGIINLINSHVLIENNDEKIVLAGVTDYSTAKINHSDASDPSKAALRAPENLVKILLAHQPASYIEAKRAGFDLQLSGHTHGGQYFPLTLLTRFIFRNSYHDGLHNYNGMWIYVNSGTGYGGPPLRIGVPAEITLIILRKAAD